jgi:hypothetical protein
MTATPGTRLLQAGVALTGSLLFMRGTDPDADRLQRLSAVVLLAALIGDSQRHHRELAHHHQALKLLTGVCEDLTARVDDLAVLSSKQHWAGPVLHFWP